MKKSNLLYKTKSIIAEPNKFFIEIKKEKGILNSFIFLSLIFLITGILLFIFVDTKQYQVAGIPPILSMILIVILNIALSFPFAYLVFLSCKLFKGKSNLFIKGGERTSADINFKLG